MDRAFVTTLLVACALLVVSRLLEFAAAAALFKLIASTAFLALAWWNGAFGSLYGRVLFAGLAFSWFGDMFLLGDTETLFLAGLGSFLLAHVCYTAAFTISGLGARWSLAASVPVAIVSALALTWLQPHLPPGSAMPVRLYTVVISLMVIAAAGTRERDGSRLIPMGALLFYLSDLSVASLQFTAPSFPHYVWGLPFYYTGQLLLASSVAHYTGNEQK